MHKEKTRRAVATGVIVALFFFFIFRTGVFRSIENTTYDWRNSVSIDKQASGDIVLIFIGDDTLELLGGWPLPRHWYAGLTDILSAAGARAVVFDMLFIDPGENDRDFAAAMKDAGNVILPFFFESPAMGGGVIYSEKAVRPVGELKDSSLSTGFINIIPDADGVIRKYPLFIEHRGEPYDSLCVAVLKDVLGWRPVAMRRNSAEFHLDGAVRNVPLSGRSSAYLNIYGDLKKFPNHSFVQVFQSYMESLGGGSPLIDIESSFMDKIVIVGSTATGAYDRGAVPGVANYPLMGVHASFIENFLKGEFIKKAGNAHNLSILLAFTMASSVAAASLSTAAGIIFIVLLSAFFMLLSFWLFSAHQFWIDMVPVFLGIVSAYGAIILMEFIAGNKEKSRLKNLFGRYLSTPVMEMLLNSKNEVMLEGEEKTVTVLFADIRGFTSFAGKHSPKESFAFLNGLMDIMTESVFRYSGTLDKFIGDEIMAVYGAPFDQPGHAVSAVLSAIDMMKSMKERAGETRIGIGINTGQAITGNLGTAKRMEYTAIGDAVNIAARIQALTAGDEIMIGAETHKLLEKSGIPCEPAGIFDIRGQDKKVELFSVLWDG